VNRSFPSAAVGELRFEIRRHRKLKQFVADRDEIDEMPVSKLLELAASLGINLDAVIADAERWHHMLRYPAFTGHYLFDITFEMLSIRIVRKACVEYDYTPEWEYYDLRKRAPYVSWAGSRMSFYVASVPDPDSRPKSKPKWERVELGEDVLPGYFWDALDNRIEQQCKVEDDERRRSVSAGKPPKPRKGKKRLPPVPVTNAAEPRDRIDLSPLVLGSGIPGWNTKIPELLLSPFTEDDFALVKKCLKALSPIERQGMKVATRIELAATLMVSACQHGFEAAEEMGGRGQGPEFFGFVEQVIVRRAREIYGQGGA